MTLLRLALLWATAAGTLWAHALLGIPGTYLGQGYPLYPGLTFTLGGLGLDAAAASLPVPVVAAFARRFRLRWLSIPLLVFLWLWAAAVLIQPFAIDFGTTWARTDLLRELVFHPVRTPVALAALIAVALWTLAPRRPG